MTIEVLAIRVQIPPLRPLYNGLKWLFSSLFSTANNTNDTSFYRFVTAKKWSKFALLILFVTTGCATHHPHPIINNNVTNFVKEIDQSHDFKTLKSWNDILRRQPIVSGTGKPSYTSLMEINNTINKKAYKATEQWLTSDEFVKANTADCKGYAVAKYYALRKAGFKASDLNLWAGDYLQPVMGGLTYQRIPHLVLVVKLYDKQYVMDIGANSNLPEAKDYFYKHFLPAYRFNENGWDIN